MAAADSTASSSDTEFDAYWEEEARNPHRNRIRIGRQYQATIPPRLKPGESDGRRLEQLETLTWKRENDLTKEKLFDYFTLSRALGLWARFRAREKLIATELSSNSSTPTGNSGSSSATGSSDSIVNSSESDATHVNTIANSVTHSNNNVNSNNSSSCSSNASGSSTKNGITANVSEDARKGSNRNRQSNNSTPSKLHNQPSSESNDEDRKVKTVGGKKQCQTTVSLDEEMHSMTKFVSSHHPNGHTSDQTCTLKSLDARSDKWSLSEARIFAHALEMYGKNFCSIKKAMPWKPAKSIIEQYYKKVTVNSDTGTGGGSGGVGGGSSSTGTGGTTADGTGEPGGSSTQFNSSSSSTLNNGEGGTDGAKDDVHYAATSPTSKNATTSLLSSLGSLDSLSDKMSDFQTLQVACLTSTGDYPTGHNLKSFTSIDSKIGMSMLKSPLSYASHVDELIGTEIKPVRAKPIFATKVPETVTTNGHNGVMNSTARGYLQFFQNGQLVLKLKGMNQGQWVQSEDSPSVPRHGKSKKCHKLNGKRQVAQITSHDGLSSRASVLSEDMSADDSSDDDSHGSSSIESRSLPSPSFAANVTNGMASVSCPPPLTRLTGSIKGCSVPRLESNAAADHVNGCNGAGGNSSALKNKRDSSNVKADECTCDDTDNCTCVASNGTTNGDCSKSKKFKGCNGNASNRNSINGLSSNNGNTAASNDPAGKGTRVSSESPNRYSMKSEGGKSNHNASNRSQLSSTIASKTTSPVPPPPPIAHSSTAVDLKSKNTVTTQQSQKIATGTHKKLSHQTTGDCAVDLSVKATGNKTPESTSNLQYSRNSSLLNVSEAVDTKNSSSLASATGDNSSCRKKINKTAIDDATTLSAAAAVAAAAANDIRSRSDWLHLLEYEQHYRSIFNQLQQQKQQQQISPVTTSAVSSSTAGGNMRKSVTTTSGNASTSSGLTSTSTSFATDHKKSKQSTERKCSGSVNSPADSGGSHGKKSSQNNKDYEKKV